MVKKKAININERWPVKTVAALLVVVATLVLFMVWIVTNKKNTEQKSSIDIEQEQVNEPKYKSGENLPNGFPEDVPIYENSKLLNSSTYTQDEKVGHSLILESDDDPFIVYKYVKDKLISDGWEVSIVSQAENAYSLSFSKNNRKGIIGITGNAVDNTIISIAVGGQL